MRNYGLDELIKDAVRSFNDTSNEMDELFHETSQLEILSYEGKDQIKDSIISTIEIALDKAIINSRKLLTEKGVVTNLKEYGDFNEQVTEDLSERAEKLQLEYEESYKEVIKLKNLLHSYND